MRELGPFLYLPIEIWAREYHAKSLLAVQAASRGWSVVIGSKSALSQRLPRLPQGTVFQFGLHKNFSPGMAQLKAAGHKVVAVDEEGLVTLNPEHYKRYRVSAEALNNSDACFCWGEVQHRMLSDVNDLDRCSLHITGNPRMDLLRPEFRDLVDREASAIKRRYGRFLLLNGNFGSFNHAMGIDYTWKSLKSKGWMLSLEDADFHRRRVLLQGRIFNAFQKAIPSLVAAGHKIIVRPHPSESLVPWQKLSKQLGDKVTVIREGNIVPWLQAASVVLHNGCTTAVEAFVLGRPVVAFRPERHPDLESELPNRISLQAGSESELIALLADIAIEDQRSRKTREEYAQSYLAGLTGSMSSERMVDALPRVEIKDTTRKLDDLGATFREWAFAMRKSVSRLAHRKSATYVDLKCGDIVLEETQDIIVDYARRLGIQKSIPVKSIGNGLILIG